jgi:hypothetical protein
MHMHEGFCREGGNLAGSYSVEGRVLVHIRSAVVCLLLLICVCTRSFAATRGTITVAGAEQISAGGAWDTGTVTITINGNYSETINYGQYSTPASVASALAATFSQDCNSPARAHAVGPQITFQMRASASTLDSLQLTSNYNMSLALSGPSFSTGNSPALVILPSQPVITGVIMTNGNAGTPITLNGINFGPSTPQGTVTINNVRASVTSWSPISVTVSIPAGVASGLVVLTTSSLLISNGVPITLTEALSCPVQ